MASNSLATSTGFRYIPSCIIISLRKAYTFPVNNVDGWNYHLFIYNLIIYDFTILLSIFLYIRKDGIVMVDEFYKSSTFIRIRFAHGFHFFRMELGGIKLSLLQGPN